MISRKASLGTLIILTAIVILACCVTPRIPQPQSYHLFADRRSFLGISKFGDVASNLPFGLIGIWGLLFLLQSRSRSQAGTFIDERERWPYLFVFAGLLLTALGSSYYHLAPDNARLLWDRLPMTITFMAMVSAVIAERINVRLREMFPGAFQNLRLMALDRYDLALIKLERNIERDRSDVRYLARAIPFDLEPLRDRYQQELRPYLATQNLKI